MTNLDKRLLKAIDTVMQFHPTYTDEQVVNASYAWWEKKGFTGRAGVADIKQYVEKQHNPKVKQKQKGYVKPTVITTTVVKEISVIEYRDRPIPHANEIVHLKQEVQRLEILNERLEDIINNYQQKFGVLE